MYVYFNKILLSCCITYVSYEKLLSIVFLLGKHFSAFILTKDFHQKKSSLTYALKTKLAHPVLC